MFESTEAGATFTRMALIHKVGRAAGIADVDYMTPGEVRAALARDDPETSHLLEAFLDSFTEWFHITEMVQSRHGRSANIEEQYVHSSEKRNQRRLELQIRLRVLEAASAR